MFLCFFLLFFRTYKQKMERAKMWEADGMSHITPEQLVPRFASSADVPRGLHNEIQRVASMTNDFAAGQGGDRRRQPASDAAGAILFVVERQQRLGTTDIAIDSIDIARLRERLQMISGMADTTIRACARDCELNEAFLYPPEEGGGDGGDGGESAAAAKDSGTDGGDGDDGDD
jgi:transcription initiation factor TFIIIB Brf1 subunit/transcription initiation factor TFIIB